VLVLVELVADALVVDPAELLLLGDLLEVWMRRRAARTMSSMVRVWSSRGTSSLSFLLTL
jgi:hypothetical protein